MQKEPKKELDYVVIGQDGTEDLNLPIMFEAIMVKYMGRIIDLCRVSGLSDRAFEQMQRTIKDECYNYVKQSKNILQKHGYGDPNDK
jgi:hypothetical protein